MKNASSKIGLSLGLIMVLIFLTGYMEVALAQQEIVPPAQQLYIQPPDGELGDGSVPGDDFYPYTSDGGIFYEPGNPEDLELSYTIFKPTEDPEKNIVLPDSIPVVLFLHGNGGAEPNPYSAWIEHIVRKGRIVIYPRYQNIPRLDEDIKKKHYLKSAIRATQLALERLEEETDVCADPDKFALIGHSLGGSFAAYIAATYNEEDIALPEPDVLLLADPTDAHYADSSMPIQTDLPVPVPEYDGSFSGSNIYQQIPSSTLFLSILAANYTTEPIYDWTKEVFIQSTAVENKNMIIMRSDVDHASVREYRNNNKLWLLANHLAVNAFKDGILEDALDYNGFWKLFDGLCMTAFDENNNVKEYALWDGQQGTTAPAKLTSLGEWKWSDGTSAGNATPLIVYPACAATEDYLPADLDEDYLNYTDDAVTLFNIKRFIPAQNAWWENRYDSSCINGSN